MLNEFTAVDLCSGVGGLSFGFENAGFKTVFAVEKDASTAETYSANRSSKDTEVIVADIRELDSTVILRRHGLKAGQIDVLLGGLPCQGFSNSNRRTRTIDNPQNSLYKEFLRCVWDIQPKWVLLENVPGIISLEKGKVVQDLLSQLGSKGYLCSQQIVDAADYSVPQRRKRFFLIANRTGAQFSFPPPIHGDGYKPHITVREAIADLPLLENGNSFDSVMYNYDSLDVSEYGKQMRSNWNKQYCSNNLVTRNSDQVIRRYEHIPTGGNWRDIPDDLMKNYKNKNICHGGIYRRLKWDEPSIVISNFRKNMLIHPEHNRGLSVREAARLQSLTGVG